MLYSFGEDLFSKEIILHESVYQQNIGICCKGHHLVSKSKNNSRKFINSLAVVAKPRARNKSRGYKTFPRTRTETSTSYSEFV